MRVIQRYDKKRVYGSSVVRLLRTFSPSSSDCARPVVAFPVGCAAEIINVQNGVVCSDFTLEALQAGITTLMSRSYDAAVIRQDMKNRFSPEKIAKQYCCLYGELSKRMELG